MDKKGSIIIIEDDKDDQDILIEVFEELGYNNKIIFFSDGLSALDYLRTTEGDPFLILSDINLPKLSGLELREKIHTDEQLALRCIPYLFFTTSAQELDVIKAYSNSVQGFFVKPSNYLDLLRTIKNILEYWKDCKAPAKPDVLKSSIKQI